MTGPRPEEIVKTKGHVYFVDIWCPTIRISWELDGEPHKLSKAYDRQKDEDVAAALNCRVIRRWNSFATQPNLRDRILFLIAEDEKHAFS